MENLVKAINTKTKKVEVVNKINNELFDFATGEKLNNYIEVSHLSWKKINSILN